MKIKDISEYTNSDPARKRKFLTLIIIMFIVDIISAVAIYFLFFNNTDDENSSVIDFNAVETEIDYSNPSANYGNYADIIADIIASDENIEDVSVADGFTDEISQASSYLSVDVLWQGEAPPNASQVDAVLNVLQFFLNPSDTRGISIVFWASGGNGTASLEGSDANQVYDLTEAKDALGLSSMSDYDYEIYINVSDLVARMQ